MKNMPIFQVCKQAKILIQIIFVKMLQQTIKLSILLLKITMQKHIPQPNFKQIFDQKALSKLKTLQRTSQQQFVWFITTTIAQMVQGQLFTKQSIQLADLQTKQDLSIRLVWKYILKQQTLTIFITFFNNEENILFDFNTTGHHMGKLSLSANKLLSQKKLQFEMLRQQKIESYKVGDICNLRLKMQLDIAKLTEKQFNHKVRWANEQLQNTIVNLWLCLFGRRLNKQKQQIKQELKHILSDKTNIEHTITQRNELFLNQFQKFSIELTKRILSQVQTKKIKCYNIKDYTFFKKKIKRRRDLGKHHLSWHVLKLQMDEEIPVINTLLSQQNLKNHNYSQQDIQLTSKNLVQIRMQEQKYLYQEILKSYPLKDITQKSNEVAQKARIKMEKSKENMKNYINKIVNIRNYQRLQVPKYYLRCNSYCKEGTNTIQMEFIQQTLLDKIKEISSNKYIKYLQGIVEWYTKLGYLILPLAQQYIWLLHCDLKQNNVVYDKLKDELLLIDLQSVRHSSKKCSEIVPVQEIILMTPLSEQFTLKGFAQNLQQIPFYQDPKLLMCEQMSKQIILMKNQFEYYLKKDKIDPVFINKMRKTIATLTYDLVVSTAKMLRPPQVASLVDSLSIFIKNQNLDQANLVLNGNGVNCLFHKYYDLYSILVCMEKKVQIFQKILPASYDKNMPRTGKVVLEMLFIMLQRKLQILSIGNTKWDYYCRAEKHSKKYTIPKSYMLFYCLDKFEEIMNLQDDYKEYIKSKLT